MRNNKKKNQIIQKTKHTNNQTVESSSQVPAKKKRKQKDNQPKKNKSKNKKIRGIENSPDVICLGSRQNLVPSAIRPNDSAQIPLTPLGLTFLSPLPLSPLQLPGFPNNYTLLSPLTSFNQTPISENFSVLSPFPLLNLPGNNTDLSSLASPNQTAIPPESPENSSVSSQNLSSSDKVADDLIQNLSVPSDLKGPGFGPDPSLAECFYEQARVLTGDFKAIYTDKENKQEYEKGTQYLQIAAHLDHPKAQYELARLYFEFKGYLKESFIEKNHYVAFKWFEKAADQNLAIAQCRLGDCYGYGYGVEKNYCKAFQLYRSAEKNELEAAQSARKLLIDHLMSVDDSLIDPFLKYTALAEEGYPSWKLGDCYQKGKGTTKDEKKAVEIYTLHANQNIPEAQNVLAHCYENGIGTLQDHKEAVRFYQLAATQGFAEAQYNLGVCYAKGKGVLQDKEEATRLFRLSADQGFAQAKYYLEFSCERSQDIEPHHKKTMDQDLSQFKTLSTSLTTPVMFCDKEIKDSLSAADNSSSILNDATLESIDEDIQQDLIQKQEEEIKKEAQQRQDAITADVAKQFGLTLVNVNNTENCFFESVSQRLRKIYEIEISANHLRFIAMEQMNLYPEKYGARFSLETDFDFNHLPFSFFCEIKPFIRKEKVKKMFLFEVEAKNKLTFIEQDFSSWSADKILDYCYQNPKLTTAKKVLNTYVYPLLIPKLTTSLRVKAHIAAMIEHISWKNEMPFGQISNQDYSRWANHIDVLAMSDALGMSLLIMRPQVLSSDSMTNSSSSSSSSASSDFSNSCSSTSSTMTSISASSSVFHLYDQHNQAPVIAIAFSNGNHYQPLGGDSAKILTAETTSIGYESGLSLLPLTPQQLKFLASKPLSTVRKNFASFPRTPELNAYYPKSQIRKKTLLGRKGKIAQNYLEFLNAADNKECVIKKNSSTFFVCNRFRPKDNSNMKEVNQYEINEFFDSQAKMYPDNATSQDGLATVVGIPSEDEDERDIRKFQLFTTARKLSYK